MSSKNTSFSEKEGQYLAFIFYYIKINGVAPAQIDFQRYFLVSPPIVHNMIVQLEKKGFITKIPKTPRALKLCLPREMIPDLK
jgi:repressor LexA